MWTYPFECGSDSMLRGGESAVKRRTLLGGGNLVDDRLRRSARIGSGKDGPGDDDEIRACSNGFRGRRGAHLVVRLRGACVVLRPHTGRDDQKIATAGFSNSARFL